MVTKYQQRKLRRGVSYLTVGVKEPRLKRSYSMSPETREIKVQATKKMWREKGDVVIAKQIERKHPWRQAYGLFGKPSSDFKIKICDQ